MIDTQSPMLRAKLLYQISCLLGLDGELGMLTCQNVLTTILQRFPRQCQLNGREQCVTVIGDSRN